MKQKVNIYKLEESIIKIMKRHGVSVLVSRSITTNSVYLKFDYGVCHSMRIGDHPGISKYGYRYSIRLDIDESYVEKRKGMNCYVACIQDTKQLLSYILKQRQVIIDKYGESRYQHFMNL